MLPGAGGAVLQWAAVTVDRPVSSIAAGAVRDFAVQVPIPTPRMLLSVEEYTPRLDFLLVRIFQWSWMHLVKVFTGFQLGTHV